MMPSATYNNHFLLVFLLNIYIAVLWYDAHFILFFSD